MKKKKLDIAKAVEEGVNPLVIVNEKQREIERALRPFLDGREYDEAVIITEIRALDHIEKVSTIEKGKRLLALKEHNAKERFAEICESLDISKRRAYEAIAMAIKFSNHPALLELGDTKLKELQDLTDDEIKKLFDKHSVDDIDLMTRDELRELVRKRKESDKNLRTHNTNLKARNALLEERLKDKDRIDEAVKSDLFAMHLRLMDAMGDFTKALASAPEEMRNDWAKKLFTGLLGHWNQMIAFCGAEIRPYYTQQMTERNFRPATEEETVVDEARKEYPLE